MKKNTNAVNYFTCTFHLFYIT